MFDFLCFSTSTNLLQKVAKKYPCREGCRFDREWKVSKYGNFSLLWWKRAVPSMEICRVETRRAANSGNTLSNAHFWNVRQELEIITEPDKKMFLAFISVFRNEIFFGRFNWFNTAHQIVCLMFFYQETDFFRTNFLGLRGWSFCMIFFGQSVSLSWELVPIERFSRKICRHNIWSFFHLSAFVRKSPFHPDYKWKIFSVENPKNRP